MVLSHKTTVTQFQKDVISAVVQTVKLTSLVGSISLVDPGTSIA